VVERAEGETAEAAARRLAELLRAERLKGSRLEYSLADMRSRMERLASATEAEEEKMTLGVSEHGSVC